MKTKTKLKLVEGSFSAKDAQEVLVNLFSNKIKFHELQNLSSKERFGTEDERAKKRIPELLESTRMILEIVKKAKDKNSTLLITSSVNIDISE